MRRRWGVALVTAVLAGSWSGSAHAARVASVSANADAACVAFFLVGDCLPFELSGGVVQASGQAVMWCSGGAPGALQVSVSCENGNDESVAATSLGPVALASRQLDDSFPTDTGSAMCIHVTVTYPAAIGGTKTFGECFPGHLIEVGS